MGINHGNCYEINTYKGNELNMIFQLTYGNLGAVKSISNGKDGGIDVNIETPKGLLCIQCKSGRKQTGVSLIREFNTACKLAKGKGWFISLANYSRDAVKLADELNIKLLDYSDMCAAARKNGSNFIYFENNDFVPVMSRSKENKVFTISFVYSGLANSGAANAIAVDSSEPYRISSKKKLHVVVNGGPHKITITDGGKKAQTIDINVKEDTDYRVSFIPIKGYRLESDPL